MISMLFPVNISTRFRVASAVLITSSILIIFVLALFRTRISDTILPINPITEQVLQEIKPLAEKVHVGLYVRNFPKFNVVNNLFTLDCVIWFKFNPENVALDEVRDFAFLNGEIRKPAISTALEPTIRRIGDQVLVFFDMNVDLTSDFSFKYFPFGRHILTIAIMDEDVTPQEIIYETDNDSFVINPMLQLATWRIDHHSTDYGYEEVCLQKGNMQKIVRFPLARFHLFFSSTGFKYIVIFFTPILFALLLALFSLLIPYKIGGDNSYMTMLSSSSFAALIAHRFVIETMIPKVGQLTVTDAIFLLALFVVFVPAVFNLIMAVYTRNKHNDTDDVDRSLRINRASTLLFIALSLITVFGLWYILLIW